MYFEEIRLSEITRFTFQSNFSNLITPFCSFKFSRNYIKNQILYKVFNKNNLIFYSQFLIMS